MRALSAYCSTTDLARFGIHALTNPARICPPSRPMIEGVQCAPRGALAASMVAASDAVVMVVPASGSPTEVKQAQTWLNQVATARGGHQLRLLARVATVHPDQASKAPSEALTSAAQRSTAPTQPPGGLRISIRMPMPFDPPSVLSGFGIVTPWFMLGGQDRVLVTAAHVWRTLTEVGI